MKAGFFLHLLDELQAYNMISDVDIHRQMQLGEEVPQQPTIISGQSVQSSYLSGTHLRQLASLETGGNIGNTHPFFSHVTCQQNLLDREPYQFLLMYPSFLLG